MNSPYEYGSETTECEACGASIAIRWERGCDGPEMVLINGDHECDEEPDGAQEECNCWFDGDRADSSDCLAHGPARKPIAAIERKSEVA